MGCVDPEGRRRMVAIMFIIVDGDSAASRRTLHRISFRFLVVSLSHKIPMTLGGCVSRPKSSERESRKSVYN